MHMKETLVHDYGVNLNNRWNNVITEAWDKAQNEVCSNASSDFLDIYRTILFSPSETISTSLWPVFTIISQYCPFSVMSAVSSYLPGVVEPSPSRPPPSSLPRYDHVHHFLEMLPFSLPLMNPYQFNLLGFSTGNVNIWHPLYDMVLSGLTSCIRQNIIISAK